MESIIDASEIPTVTLLYELGRLDWKPNEGLPLIAHPEYNDKVAHIRADITKLRVDAIVNAAKPSLRGGGGVDGAIHLAAGPGLLKECLTLQGCMTGEAKITDGYNLPSDKVIHTVGPIYGHYGSRVSAEYLRDCYRNSLELAVENGCKTVAFSALSTGFYGYPNEDAARIAISSVRDFVISQEAQKIEKIIFCSFTERDMLIYEKMIPMWFPPVDEEKFKNKARPSRGPDDNVQSGAGGKAEIPRHASEDSESTSAADNEGQK